MPDKLNILMLTPYLPYPPVSGGRTRTYNLIKRLRRDVNPVVMTQSAFEAKVASRDRFAVRVVREPKIVLLGDAGELAKLAEDRTA